MKKNKQRPGIYLLAFPDGNYVGQSSNVITRLRKHKSQMLEGIHPNRKIRSGFAKYGMPEMTILLECSLEELNDAEIFYMNTYNCYPNGYNQQPGGGVKRPVAISVAYHTSFGEMLALISCILLLSTIFIAAIVKSCGLPAAILLIFAIYAIIRIWP